MCNSNRVGPLCCLCRLAYPFRGDGDGCMDVRLKLVNGALVGYIVIDK